MLQRESDVAPGNHQQAKALNAAVRMNNAAMIRSWIGRHDDVYRCAVKSHEPSRFVQIDVGISPWLSSTLREKFRQPGNAAKWPHMAQILIKEWILITYFLLHIIGQCAKCYIPNPC